MTITSRLYTMLPVWVRRFVIDDINPQEIRADEIALEREEKRLEQTVDQAQDEIDEITRDAVASGKKASVRRAVRKIMQIKDRVRIDEAQLTHVSNQLAALGRLRRVTEGREQLAASGVLARLKGLPQAQLEHVLSGAVARSELVAEGLGQVADIINVPAPSMTEEPEEARRLREAMEAAIAANDPALAQQAVDRVRPTAAGIETL